MCVQLPCKTHRSHPRDNVLCLNTAEKFLPYRKKKATGATSPTHPVQPIVTRFGHPMENALRTSAMPAVNTNSTSPIRKDWKNQKSSPFQTPHSSSNHSGRLMENTLPTPIPITTCFTPM